MLPRGRTPPPRPRMTLPRAMTPPCAKGRGGNPPAGTTQRSGGAAAPAAKKQAQFPDGQQPATSPPDGIWTPAGRQRAVKREPPPNQPAATPLRSKRAPPPTPPERGVHCGPGGSAPSARGSVPTSGMTGNAAKAQADEAGRHQEALIKDDCSPLRKFPEPLSLLAPPPDTASPYAPRRGRTGTRPAALPRPRAAGRPRHPGTEAKRR